MARRLFFLIMVAVPTVLVLSGCEQYKDYRKRVYYEKALELFESQNYSEAIVQNNHALVFDSDYLDAVYLKALCLYELKNYLKAGRVFERAALIDDSRDDLLFKTADAFYKAGKFLKATQYTTIVLENDPDNAQARYLEARSRLRSRFLSMWSGAADLLQPLLKDEEFQNRAFALLAEFHILNNNYAQAEQFLMEHADANEDWIYVMRLLAEKYDALGEQEATLRVYRELAERNADSFQDTQRLLAYMRKIGRKEEEVRFLESLISKDGQQPRYKLALIDFYIHYGYFSEAEKFIHAGIESGEGYVDFSRCLIELYKKLDRYAEAIQVAKDVLAHLEEDAKELNLEFMNILARLYYEETNVEMAKVAVRWILHIDSDDKRARFLQARIALDSGRTLLAISALRRLASEDADNPEYDYYTGLAHMQRGESSNAEQSFHEVLKKDPLHKQALLKLSAIYIEKGFFPDVRQMLNKFLAINPNDPDALALQAALEEKLAVSPEAP